MLKNFAMASLPSITIFSHEWSFAIPSCDKMDQKVIRNLKVSMLKKLSILALFALSSCGSDGGYRNDGPYYNNYYNDNGYRYDRGRQDGHGDEHHEHGGQGDEHHESGGGSGHGEGHGGGGHN
jgi:hypothetical protein